MLYSVDFTDLFGCQAVEGLKNRYLVLSALFYMRMYKNKDKK